MCHTDVELQVPVDRLPQRVATEEAGRLTGEERVPTRMVQSS
jgi:hypothetical protein